MIANLRLQHFRSYKDDSFEFSPGVNLVVGPNAIGKSNLLEAILVLARGGSYRVKDSDLIQFGETWARLDAQTEKDAKRSVKIVGDTENAKSFEIDGKTYRRLTLSNMLPIVLFEPNNLQLLSGGPDRRREFIDDLLEQTTAGYGVLRRQYRRALAQRNALLKQDVQNAQTKLFPWNVRLSQLAGQIVQARNQLTEQLNKQNKQIYKELSRAKTKVELTYDSRWLVSGYDSNYLKKLESSLEIDKLRGFTSTGPHREDLKITFDGRLAQETASRGEIRSFILSLKICELQILEKYHNTKPLLLLDDVFSELDGKRRHALTDYLSSYQTFITTTDADLVINHLTGTTNILPIG
jgi:DNA replication and repair protein RecF